MDHEHHQLGESAVGSARELAEATARYRELIERMPAVSFIAEPGRDGRFHYVSPQIETILGYTPAEWTANRHLWYERLHPDDRAHVVAAEERAIRHGGSSRKVIDYRMITRDGRVVWIRDEEQLDRVDGTLLCRGLLYDISDMKAAETELARRAAQQEAVARLGEQALKGTALKDLLEEAVAAAVRVLDVESAVILELGDDPGELTPVAAIGFADADAGSAIGTLAGQALHGAEPIVVDDWPRERHRAQPDVLRQLGVRSALAVRIEGCLGPFGVLELHARETARFTAAEEAFVRSVCNVLADAIRRCAADDEIRHQALHDPLTGLPNRVLFADRLAQALARSVRHHSLIAILFLDLDNFKLVNDTLGHEAGDALLVAVAPRMRQTLRPSDTLARFGGDEFGVLVEDIADESAAVRVAERLAAAFARPFAVGGVEHFVTASVGIALARGGEGDPTSLIRDADAAMYRAKERGRARYEIFDQVMRARAVERLVLENDLRRAVDRHELRVHYQPIVSLRDDSVFGVEALVRWQHPERGLLEPEEFLAVAEGSGLIDALGMWVLHDACRQTARWQQTRPDAPPLNLFVNLSPRQLNARDFAEQVARTLRTTDLQPQCLHLEITEGSLIEETAPAAAMLASLRDLGVRVVLDDFCTGYASLGYLRRFPLDVLKLDKSLTAGLAEGEEGSAIVAAVVAMARAMRLEVIAEGVESPEHVTRLRELGCGYAQGFHFSRPLVAERAIELVGQTGPIQRS